MRTYWIELQFINVQGLSIHVITYFIIHVLIYSFYWVNKFGLLVFYLFGRPVKISGCLAFIYSAVRFWPYGPTSYILVSISVHVPAITQIVKCSSYYPNRWGDGFYSSKEMVIMMWLYK